jgi:hypothetical protein
MSDLCRLIWCALIGLFRPRAALQAENLVLRHQLNVLRRKSPKRVVLGSIDRLLLVGLYRLAPGVLDALKIKGRRRCCAGTVPASAPFGAGNRDRAVADRGRRPTFVASFAR